MAARARFGLAAALALGVATVVPASAETNAFRDEIGDIIGGQDAQPAPPEDADVTGAIDPSPTAEPAPAQLARPHPGHANDQIPLDLLISLANSAVFTPDPFPTGRRADPRLIKLQVLLDRNHVSPGVIDGLHGGNLSKAIMAFEEMRGLPIDGVLDAEVWRALNEVSDEDVLSYYAITEQDVAGPFVAAMPHDYGEMAELERLAYRDAAELLAEKFHMDEGFLRRLNPDVHFGPESAGQEIVVANIGKNLRAKVASIVADKGRKQLLGYDAGGRLVVAYPATIGSSTLPSPTGVHAVKAIAIDPEYWYRPQVNFVQGENRKALRLAPGPNGPVGAVWIGLDKPTYGLHGTPEPSKIDKTNSHGCVRLTNWDAQELARLVAPGVPVDFREPEVMASADPEPPLEMPQVMQPR